MSDERREAHVAALVCRNMPTPEEAYDGLLAHLDESDDEGDRVLANGLRWGLVKTVTNIDDRGIEVHETWPVGTSAYGVGHPKDQS